MDQSLILILGDQLSHRISSLRDADKTRTIVLMAEVMVEARYVPHHKKKLALVYSAMRHFANELRLAGWQVDYVRLEDEGNSQSLAGEVTRAMQRHAVHAVCVTEAGEWRVREDLSAIPNLTFVEDDRFICTLAAFRRWAEGRRELRMEYFYRDMRRQTGLLMKGDEPAGGRWNFDAENRKPAGGSLFLPKPPRFVPDEVTEECIEMVERVAPQNFGTLRPFWFPVTAAQAHVLLDHFIEHALPHFGETQDAMLQGEAFMHHSLLSMSINLGLLHPVEVCRRAEAEYHAGQAPLEAVEGFIRQIIGWREYVRGIYWLKMPGYASSNELQAKLPLPAFYWDGETPMNCVAHVVRQTREEAYAHHIQRLMVTGNFALLAGLNPAEVHEWYLSVYADAFEWVELPNTIGMALHADGGLLGSKPYAASGAYINRMSDYCKSCRYDVKKRVGDDACPFNALYWNFVARHLARFRKNPRMAPICKSYERFSEADKQAIARQADAFLKTLVPWRG